MRTEAIAIPAATKGVVVFVGSRDTYLASLLNQHGIATLLLDPAHDDLDVIAGGLRGFPLGLFGTGTAGTAALVLAAQRIDLVSAVVCWGGRPDLAGAWLPSLRAPTLSILGSRDTAGLRVHLEAGRVMVAPHKLLVIPGASPQFEEPGALEEVAAATTAWFAGHLICREGAAITTAIG